MKLVSSVNPIRIFHRSLFMLGSGIDQMFDGIAKLEFGGSLCDYMTDLNYAPRVEGESSFNIEAKSGACPSVVDYYTVQLETAFVALLVKTGLDTIIFDVTHPMTDEKASFVVINAHDSMRVVSINKFSVKHDIDMGNTVLGVEHYDNQHRNQLIAFASNSDSLNVHTPQFMKNGTTAKEVMVVLSTEGTAIKTFTYKQSDDIPVTELLIKAATTVRLQYGDEMNEATNVVLSAKIHDSVAKGVIGTYCVVESHRTRCSNTTRWATVVYRDNTKH